VTCVSLWWSATSSLWQLYFRLTSFSLEMAACMQGGVALLVSLVHLLWSVIVRSLCMWVPLANGSASSPSSLRVPHDMYCGVHLRCTCCLRACLIKEGKGQLSFFSLVGAKSVVWQFVPITMGSVFHHGPILASMVVCGSRRRNVPQSAAGKWLGSAGSGHSVEVDWRTGDLSQIQRPQCSNDHRWAQKVSS
jgi:hypothetical protein